MRSAIINKNGEKMGLNPCFNGIYSMRKDKNFTNKEKISLNPCFNGIYSMRKNGKNGKN